MLEELRTLRHLPTLGKVLHGYFWQQHQLQIDKGPSYHPFCRDIAKLFEVDI